MSESMKKAIISIFWAITSIAIALIAFMITTMIVDIESFSFLFLVIPAVTLTALGISLIVLAVKAGPGKLLKAFLLLTGSSATGITAGAILHNLVYALIVLLSETGLFSLPADFDEPFFFMIAVIIAPMGLVVGIIGSAVLIHNKKALE